MEVDAASFGREVRVRVGNVLGGADFEVGAATWLGRIEHYARLLTVWGRRHNLVSAADQPAEVAFHIIDCLTPLGLPGMADLLEPGTEVLDLGSGAGLPGLLIAAVGEARVTLLESRRKRVSFLRVAAAQLGLRNVAIYGRHLGSDESIPSFEVVVGRAFAKPALFFAAARAALRPGGRAILYAGAGAVDLGGAAEAGRLEAIEYLVADGVKGKPRKLLIWRQR